MHPGLSNIGKILKDLHSVLRSSERSRDNLFIDKELPVMAFRRLKNLKDYLVSAKLSKVDQELCNNRGTARCDNR